MPRRISPSRRRRDRWLMPALWIALLVVGSVAPAMAGDIGPYADQRHHCEQLRFDADYAGAYQCLQTLWNDKGDEMSLDGKVDVLQQMAELYVIYAKRPEEARNCYEKILGLDPHWLPDSFDVWPASYRQPVLDAYRARGYLMRSPALRNVAVLDFEIGDLLADETNLESINRALPDYISSYLQEVLRDASLKDDQTPLHLISYRERNLIMQELRQEAEDPAALNTAQLVQAGQMQAVQGFLKGSILRGLDHRVNISLQLISVETAEVLCPVTVDGKDKNLFPLLQKALRKWVRCAVVGAEVKEKAGAAELGPMAQGVLALERFHEALELAENERYDEAIQKTELALQLRPNAAEIQRFLDELRQQQEYAGLALADEEKVDLPSLKLQ